MTATGWALLMAALALILALTSASAIAYAYWLMNSLLRKEDR